MLRTIALIGAGVLTGCCLLNLIMPRKRRVYYRTSPPLPPQTAKILYFPSKNSP